MVRFSWEVDDFFLKRKGKVALCYDLFFLLYSQAIRIFCPTKCLTALGVVTCVTHGWILVQVEICQPNAFLKMVAGQERLYSSIKSPVGWGSMIGPGL